MSDISQIDKNFEVKTASGDGMFYFSCLEKPFSVHGVIQGENSFVRLPTTVAASVSRNVEGLNYCTAGGRVRFVTDSPKINVRVKLNRVGKMPHFALTGSIGCDLYDGKYYAGTFVPPFDVANEYESSIDLKTRKTRELTINMPLYSGVSLFEIGLCAGSSLKAAKDYKLPVPVVYYGSSITQGGCASRPGNSYQSIISRELDCDYINLGFSGSAKAEDEIARYIAGLEMSAFVYDYDYNAPDSEHLKNTHERMFKIIRESQPELPVLMLSRPQSRLDEEARRRRDIIMHTYISARDAGDENVYFLDGGHILNIFGGDSGTVDNCHPNDLGFMCMAKAIGNILKEIL